MTTCAEQPAKKSTTPSVAIVTFGCKANQYDGAVLAAQCQQQGLRVVSADDAADAYIVNTCTVTAHADHEARALWRKLRRKNPRALIVATGCYAEVASEEVARESDVSFVRGRGEKMHIVAEVAQALGVADAKKIQSAAPEAWAASPRGVVLPGHARAFFKIQDGCNLYCTYCIIPKARGAQRSLPVHEVMAHLRAYAEQGFDEVVLTGIHIGTYGRDLSPTVSFTQLLAMIARHRPVRRVRVSSLDPHEVTPEMLELFANSDVLCPHVHLPIQSGSDRVLKRMARLYRRDTIDRVLENFQRALPHVAIGTDMIVGFPGESDDDFAATCDLVERSPLTYVHVFPYSARAGTPATKLRDVVSHDVQAARCEHLRALSVVKRQTYYHAQLGKTLDGICENKIDRRTGRYRVLTTNYVPVLMPAEPARRGGRYHRVRITTVTPDEVTGQWM